MLIQVPLGDDLSRFASNNLYTESITLYLYKDQPITYKCPGMILAHRSKVLENLIGLGEKEIVLDKSLFTSNDHAGISDVIKILHGGHVELTNENFPGIWKFSAKYEWRAVFELCFNWVRDHLTVDNFIPCPISVEWLKNVAPGQEDVLTL